MNIQGILDAIDKGLGVIQGVASIPGVSLIPYAATLSSAIGVIQLMIKAGENIEPFIANIKDTFSTPPTSADDVAALNARMVTLDAQIAGLRARLQAPLPSAEPGEPE